MTTHFKSIIQNMLSTHGMNFIPGWAFAESISSLAEHTRKWFHCWLSIRGNDFIAGWAYEEMISSLAEHTRKWFHRWLSMLGNVYKLNISAESNMIFKNLVLQAPGIISFRFLQKNSKNKFNACVPSFKGTWQWADFLGFLQKLVPHESLTLHFEPFRFSLRIQGDISNWKTNSRLAESGSQQDCL